MTLRRVDPEKAEPVDHIEDEEEAGEETEKHEVHPGRPHLLVSYILKNDGQANASYQRLH